MAVIIVEKRPQTLKEITASLNSIRLSHEDYSEIYAREQLGVRG